ncbi:MAG TPA: nucleotidyltransferase domain-containing protein [Methylococcaceae bacterium]|nr:nucleotidyltransferase domain-containing protein [Methylococcaceae bacterium]
MAQLSADAPRTKAASVCDEWVRIVLAAYPGTQAIYLFGSWGTDNEWPDSDVDLAALLPHEQAKRVDLWRWNALAVDLGRIVHKKVDLLNLRQVSTVFQKEVILADRRIYTADKRAAEEFEMLTVSFYQKLNEERREILNDFWRTGSAYRV